MKYQYARLISKVNDSSYVRINKLNGDSSVLSQIREMADSLT